MCLDGGLEPVPAGVVGELYICGSGAGAGLSGSGGADGGAVCGGPVRAGGGRMYRTGDLARWRADGVLEFLGRADAAGEAARVPDRARRDRGGAAWACRRWRRRRWSRARTGRASKRLVGYVVAAAAARRRCGGAARACWRERLPDYMVPSAFVVLERLPLTPNGKLDRRALPAPEHAAWCGGASGAAHAAGGGPVRGCSPRCWAWSGSGIDDNFFALGGHSLLATRLISRVRASAGCGACDPRRCSRRRRWRRWPRGLRRASEAARRRCAAARRGPAELPLSFAQQRLWFLDRLERRRARPTPSRWRCGCRGAGRGGAGGGAAAMWSSGTRACARSSRSAWACRARRSWRRAAGAARGWRSREVERGASCARGAGARAAARAASICAREPPLRAHAVCGCGERRARAAAGAAPHCRRRLVAGRRWRGIWRRSTRRGVRGEAPRLAALAGAVCRLHAVAARGAGRRGRSGRARWRASSAYWRERAGGAARRSSSCRPTGRGRRWRAIAAAAVPLQLSARAARGLAGAGAARAGRACSWCCRRGWRRC